MVTILKRCPEIQRSCYASLMDTFSFSPGDLQNQGFNLYLQLGLHPWSSEFLNIVRHCSSNINVIWRKCQNEILILSAWGLKFCTSKAMAPHSSTLAWKIPWMEEPGGLPSMGSRRVGHDRSDLAAAATNLQLMKMPLVHGSQFEQQDCNGLYVCYLLNIYPRLPNSSK